MTCGLAEEELEILNILRVNYSFSRNKTFDFRYVAKAYRDRFNKNPVDVADKLRKKGYVTFLSKREGKYYISNESMTFYALGAHEYISAADMVEKRIRSSRVRRL